MGAYESNYVEVALKFTPKVLNPKSKGKWLKAHIVLPEYYDVNHLDVNSPAKLYPHSIESDYVYAFVNEEGLVEVEIGFKRSAFCGVEIDNSQTEGIVIGKLTTGEDFYGVGTIEIMDKSLEYVALLSNYWLEPVCSEPDWCDSLDFNHDTVVNFVDYAMMLNECCVEIITDN
jgi:hypothetical protein